MAESILQLYTIPEAARRARRLLGRRLQGVLATQALNDAVLLASELVVARVIATRQQPVRRIWLGLRIDEDEVVVRVSDDLTDAGLADAWWPADGHGVNRMRLLDALSAEWSVEPGPPLAVWFAMRRPHRAGAA